MGGALAEKRAAPQRSSGIHAAAIVGAQKDAAAFAIGAVVVVGHGQAASLGIDSGGDDVKFGAGQPGLATRHSKATTLGRALADVACDDVAGGL